METQQHSYLVAALFVGKSSPAGVIRCKRSTNPSEFVQQHYYVQEAQPQHASAALASEHSPFHINGVLDYAKDQ